MGNSGVYGEGDAILTAERASFTLLQELGEKRRVRGEEGQADLHALSLSLCPSLSFFRRPSVALSRAVIGSLLSIRVSAERA